LITCNMTTFSDRINLVFEAEEDLVVHRKVIRIFKRDITPVKMRMSTTMIQAMEAVCDKSFLDYSTIKFTIGDREIKEDDTPEILHLKERDIIMMQNRTEDSDCISKSTFIEDFKTYFTDNSLSDVEFKLDDGTTLKAHKFILCARCPKFKAMFTRGMLESNSNEVVISGHSRQIFSAMLEYLYCDAIPKMAPNLMLELLCLSDEYLLARLKRICEWELVKLIEVENVSSLLCNANHYHAEFLKEKCLNFILQNYTEVVSSPNFETDLQSPELLHNLLRTIASEGALEVFTTKKERLLGKNSH